MSTFIERLRTEKQELDEKLTKLEDFLATDAFTALANIDKLLLEKQFGIMTEYSRVLNSRLMRLEQAN
jgi:hypothetical protein